MSPPKRALNEPDDNLTNKRPRSGEIRACFEGGEDDVYGDAGPPHPMGTDVRVAQQAQATPEPSRLNSSMIPAPSFVDDNSTTRDAHECSTLGWNRNTKKGSERAISARRMSAHFSGSVESRWDSACAPIDGTRLGGSEEIISPLYLEEGNRDPSSTEGSKSKGKEREESASPSSTKSTQPTTSVLLPSSLYFEDTPASAIASSVHRRNQQDVPHVTSWSGTPTIGGDSSSSESTSYPLWGLDNDELDASLERLDEYFFENPHLILTPADVAALPTSFNSTTFGAAQMLPHQHNGSTMDITSGYSQSVHLNTTSPLSSPPSSSSPLSSASSRSRSYPVYYASAPMGTVSEATVLWLVCNVPPAQISSRLPQVLSLPEPETQLSVLVLREVLGRHPVTANEVNEFETMVYNESVDERWRGRRYRQRKPRRRSHN